MGVDRTSSKGRRKGMLKLILILVPLLVIVLLVLGGCKTTKVATPATTSPTTSAAVLPSKLATTTTITITPSPSTSATVTTSPSTPAAPEIPLSFSGQGDYITTPFMLNEGITAVTYAHKGSSTFIIRLMDESGNIADTIIDDHGSLHGLTTLSIWSTNPTLKPGIHFFTIIADGKWAINIGKTPDFPTLD